MFILGEIKEKKDKATVGQMPLFQVSIRKNVGGFCICQNESMQLNKSGVTQYLPNRHN